MLKTIEVEIDSQGRIHPLEKMPLPLKGKSRALLTILPAPMVERRLARKAKSTVPAWGIISASRSVSLSEMEAVIRARGGKL